ncbi:Uncharacterised protein [Pseudomonas aeruginosa]|nr:Uncharacterised protein [Pseudomonas aeruginosa]
MIRCRNCGEHPASEGHICMVCKRRSDVDPYKALIAMALLVYCGVSLAAYLKPHMPSPPPTAGSSVQPAEELASAPARPPWNSAASEERMLGRGGSLSPSFFYMHMAASAWLMAPDTPAPPRFGDAARPPTPAVPPPSRG